MQQPKIFYIHGFNSSGNAKKSQLLRAAIKEKSPEVEYYSPTLVHDPIKAIQQLQNALDKHAEGSCFCFVGSSLGGFYAIYLAHRYPKAKAVLINPTTNPWETMSDYCGDYDNEATGEKFSVTLDFVASLENFKCKKIIHPERFLLLLQKDDDIIDYHVAQEVFADSPQIIRTGGGHQFIDFIEVIPDILRFAVGDGG